MTFQSTGNGGLLWRALAISLVLHAILLTPRPPALVTEPVAASLRATLRPLAATTSAPTFAVAAAGAVSSAPTFAAARPVATQAPSTGPTATTAPDRTSPVASTEPTGAAASSEMGAGLPRADGLDAEGLRQYRLALAREARRFKRYPEQVQREGIGGTVEVRVEHGAVGVPVLRLARSSGNAALDDAALDMLRRAAPRAPLPESLSGRAFVLSLPVVFAPELE